MFYLFDDNLGKDTKRSQIKVTSSDHAFSSHTTKAIERVWLH